MTSQDQSQWPSIPQPGTSLADWQTYVDELVRARGWDKASDLETFLLFTEEVGELAKAYRRHRNLFTEHSKATESSQSKEGTTTSYRIARRPARYLDPNNENRKQMIAEQR